MLIDRTEQVRIDDHVEAVVVGIDTNEKRARLGLVVRINQLVQLPLQILCTQSPPLPSGMRLASSPIQIASQHHWTMSSRPVCSRLRHPRTQSSWMLAVLISVNARLSRRTVYRTRLK